MFSSNLALSGLALGVIGCVSSPLIYPYFSTGGGINPSNETISSTTQVTQQEGAQTTVPKRDTFVKLLLAGTKVEDGLVAELSRENKEDSQWKVGRVTWRGESWNRNWTLYSDDTNGEYTFTDKTWYELRSGCYAQARSWKGNKVCVTYGRVTGNDKKKWTDNFPKINLKGWVTLSRGGGYSVNAYLDNISNCSLKTTESKTGGNKLTITITCDEGRLTKTLNDSDFSTMTIEKH